MCFSQSRERAVQQTALACPCPMAGLYLDRSAPSLGRSPPPVCTATSSKKLITMGSSYSHKKRGVSSWPSGASTGSVRTWGGGWRGYGYG